MLEQLRPKSDVKSLQSSAQRSNLSHLKGIHTAKQNQQARQPRECHILASRI